MDVPVRYAVKSESKIVKKRSTNAIPRIRVAWTPCPGTPKRFA